MNCCWKKVSLSLIAIVSAWSMMAQAALDTEVIVAKPEGFEVTSTLIKGKEEAILIDSQLRLSDAHRVVAAVMDSKLKLNTVYITHDHPDHYFGFEVIKSVYGAANYVALPVTLKAINETWKSKLTQWKPLYGTNLTDAPLVPKEHKGNLVLDGEKLEIVGGVQGDDANNSYVWIPSIETVITGDIAYNNVHVWTAETTPAERKQWSATIDKILSLNPKKVIAGHKTQDSPDTLECLKFTQKYLADFDRFLSQSSSAEELEAKMLKEYPKLGQPIILSIGAKQAFAKK